MNASFNSKRINLIWQNERERETEREEKKGVNFILLNIDLQTIKFVFKGLRIFKTSVIALMSIIFTVLGFIAFKFDKVALFLSPPAPFF